MAWYCAELKLASMRLRNADMLRILWIRSIDHIAIKRRARHDLISIIHVQTVQLIYCDKSYPIGGFYFS